MESRSFYYKDYQFPICARCTGVFLGEISSVIAILLGFRVPLYVAIILLAIMGLDWFIQEINILQSTNLRRLITGLFGGIGTAFIYFCLLKFIYYLLFT